MANQQTGPGIAFKIDRMIRKIGRTIVHPTPRARVWMTTVFFVLLAAFLAWYDAPAQINPLLKKAGLNITRETPFRLGLDLKGGAHLIYEADMKNIGESDRRDSLEGVRDVIERRVNAFGVAEPVVQTSRAGGSYRVIVELAGVTDIGQAIAALGETPTLDFREVNPEPSKPLSPEQEKELTTFNAEAKKRAEDVLKKVLAPGADFGALAKEFSEDPGSKDKGGDLGFFATSSVVKPFADALVKLKNGETTRALVQSQFGYHVIKRIEDKGEEIHAQHILIKTKTAADIAPAEPWIFTSLTGKNLRRASLQFEPQTNEPTVALDFNDEGAKLFESITERNIDKQVAIFLDGEIISAPVVRSKITGGRAIISGNFDIRNAKLLAQRLNAGALPVPITLISQETVGASLGADSLHKSLVAGLFGFLLVALFMILYYRLPGLLSVGALVLYTGIVLAIFKMIPVTLSLSGIAGFILSLGMAVDANVLIFERTKEELKSGKPLGSAIEEGFKRAWPSIRDGNYTTLISAAVLFWFSSSVIKGFALTLAVGVIVSMFSALTITRNFLRVVSAWVRRNWWYGV